MNNIVSTTQNIVIRPVAEKDIDRAVMLMNSQYARKKNHDYFRWLYFDTFFPSVLIGAFHEERLVGMFGLQKKKLNNKINIGQLIDLLIAPDFRKQGIFSRLAEKAFDHFKDIETFCVLPNQNGKNACERSLGFKTITKIDSMVIVKENFNSDYIPDETISDKADDPVSFEKNETYRSWRFDKNPIYRYDKTILSDKTFAITKIFTDPVTGDKYGDIVEYECEKNSSELTARLFTKTVEDLFKNDIKNITTWALPRTNLFRILKNIGFAESPAERYFCIKVLNNKYEYLNNINNWKLFQSDAEIF